MINFEITPPKTVRSLTSIPFLKVEELTTKDLPFTDYSYLFIALKSGTTLEELNQLTDNLPEKMQELKIAFELFESLDMNILYIFN